MALVPAYTGDPDKKCHFDTCQQHGSHKCKWDNHCCRPGGKSASGGCKKRYCNAHKHEKVVHTRSKRGTRTHIYQCCVDCSDKLEKDIKEN